MHTHILDGHPSISKNGKSFWCVKHQKTTNMDALWSFLTHSTDHQVQVHDTRKIFNIFQTWSLSSHIDILLLKCHWFFSGGSTNPYQPPIGNASKIHNRTVGPCCGLDGILLCIGDVWIDGRHTFRCVVVNAPEARSFGNFPMATGCYWIWTCCF